MEPKPYIATNTLNKVLAMRRKYRFASGGTGAAKTTSIMQVLLDMAGSLKSQRIDIVSKSIPHVRDGAWDETNRIIQANNYGPYVQVLHTPDMHIVLPTKSELHFLSFDKYSKAHGPRRNALFINEANYIPWPIANQLMVRTSGPVFADWNPTAKFWAYDEIMENPAYKDQFDFVSVTYKDNQSLTPEQVADLERRRSNLSWWKVYGLGQLGELEGQVYSGWRWLNDIPFEARLIRRGMDFGFTNDPTAIIAIYEYNGGLILDEECYQRGMDNQDIADFIGALKAPHTPIIADSSEPKSIAEVRKFGKPYGLSVLPVQKYAGSKLDQVEFVKTQPISVTTRSLNLREEYEQYLWVEDQLTGLRVNQLPDGFDHALDATRYGVTPYMARIKREHDPTRKRREKGNWSFAERYG